MQGSGAWPQVLLLLGSGFHSVDHVGLVASNGGGGVKQIAPHQALKIMERCKLTFDEMVVLHLVVGRESGVGVPRSSSYRMYLLISFRSQHPQNIVNLSFTVTNIKNTLTDLTFARRL